MKKWLKGAFKSKTIIFNTVVAPLLMILVQEQALLNAFMSEKHVLLVTFIANVILRFITNKPLDNK